MADGAAGSSVSSIESHLFYRFSWTAGGQSFTAVWVSPEPRERPPGQAALAQDLAERFELPADHRDWQLTTVRVDPADACHLSIASVAYLTALRAATGRRAADEALHTPWYRAQREPHPRNEIITRFHRAVEAAERAYQPSRDEATRYLDKAVAPPSPGTA